MTHAPRPRTAPPSPASSRARKPTSFDRRIHRSYSTFHALRQWSVRHLTAAGALLFWAMLAAGSFTDTGQTMAHQLFGLFFGVLLSGLVFLRKPHRRFEIQRDVPRHGTAGSSLLYRVRIRNLTRRSFRSLEYWEGLPDPRPTPEEFAAMEEPGEGARNWFDRRYRFYRWRWLCERNTRARHTPTPVPSIPPGATIEIQTRLELLRRGRLTLLGAEVARTDAFGLFRRLGIVREQAASVLVLPRRFPLPALPLPGLSRRLQAGGVALAGAIGESEEFVSVREYRPGDPLRRIHWAGWARTQRPAVKEFQEEFFVRHALVLDTFGGGLEADAFEDAVSVAASFAATVDRRDSLLDLMFVGDRAYVFTGGRGLSHAEQMLEVLASVDLNPLGDPTALEQMVLRHAPGLSGCILVLLSWDAARERLRDALEARQAPTLTFVVHRDPPPAGTLLPPNVHWLASGKVAEQLASLGQPHARA